MSLKMSVMTRDKQLQQYQALLGLIAAFPDGAANEQIAKAAAHLNLSRNTLRDAAHYVEANYKKQVLPAHVRDRVLGWKQDTRIQGDDLKSDLYYMTAHLRQLIDRVVGKMRYSGPLTLEQVEKLPNGKVMGSVVVRMPPQLLDKFILDLRKELASGSFKAADYAELLNEHKVVAGFLAAQP